MSGRNCVHSDVKPIKHSWLKFKRKQESETGNTERIGEGKLRASLIRFCESLIFKFVCIHFRRKRDFPLFLEKNEAMVTFSNLET